jgi:hypothetical protein
LKRASLLLVAFSMCSGLGCGLIAGLGEFTDGPGSGSAAGSTSSGSGSTGSSGDDGGACGDVSSDSLNCGACGRDCLGGACEDGACKPVPLATGEGAVTRIAVHGPTAYWVNDQGIVRACEWLSCQSSVRTLAFTGDGGYGPPSTSLGLGVDGTHVYWSFYYHSFIYRCAVGGCPAGPEAFASGPAVGFPYGLVVDDTNVYWTEQSGHSVLRCPKAGCPAPEVLTPSPEILPRALTQDGDSVYWVAAGIPGEPPGILARAPKDAMDGGASVATYQLESPRGVAVRGSTIYYAEWGPVTDAGAQTQGKISRVTGPSIPVIVAGSQAQPTPLTLDDEALYWGNQGDGTIRRCALAGCSGMPEAIASGQLLPSGIAVNEKAVYWCTLDGAVVMLAK